MNASNIPIGRWYIGFGLFLILCGIAGYASNPLEAQTALISGGTFGTISAGWGFWMTRSKGLLPKVAAGLTTLMLIGAFIWRSIVSWQAVAEGEPKRFAASLISTMLIASVLSMVRLLRSSKNM